MVVWFLGAVTDGHFFIARLPLSGFRTGVFVGGIFFFFFFFLVGGRDTARERTRGLLAFLFCFRPNFFVS
jgi:hypothetical protein